MSNINTKLLLGVMNASIKILERMEHDNVEIGTINVTIAACYSQEGSDDLEVTDYNAELLERIDGTWEIEEIIKNGGKEG